MTSPDEKPLAAVESEAVESEAAAEAATGTSPPRRDRGGHRGRPGRRGRRPGGADTRTALIAAARSAFAEGGYHRTTVRAIAARAGVDPAMVNHWFGGKDGLFAQAVLRTPFHVDDLLSDIVSDGPDRLGENMVRRFVTVWDGSGGDTFAALVRSVTTHEESLDLLKTALIDRLLPGITAAAGADRPELRASLCATQIIGLGMARYVARLEPVASADIDTLVASLAPTLQRYLTGDLGDPPSDDSGRHER